MNTFHNGHSPDDGLVKLAIEDVQKSGLSFETLHMAQVKLFSGTADILKERLGRTSINGHSLVGAFRLVEFPYFNEDGDIILYRYKVIPTTTDQAGKEVKYLHPTGSPAIPYILPVVWDIKDKTHKPVWITEGEKKCLKLIQHGRSAIALSGVWNFRGNNPGDEDLFSELKNFQWYGRTVYLAFDSDLWINPSVRAALYELSFKLHERKAIVKMGQW